MARTRSEKFVEIRRAEIYNRFEYEMTSRKTFPREVKTFFAFSSNNLLFLLIFIAQLQPFVQALKRVFMVGN